MNESMNGKTHKYKYKTFKSLCDIIFEVYPDIVKESVVKECMCKYRHSTGSLIDYFNQVLKYVHIKFNNIATSCDSTDICLKSLLYKKGLTVSHFINRMKQFSIQDNINKLYWIIDTT